MSNTGGFTDVNFFDCVTKQYMVDNELDAAGMIEQMENNENHFDNTELSSITELTQCVNHNPAITSINGIDKLTRLTNAQLNNNAITSIDALSSSSLTLLNLTNNQLTSANAAGFPNLETLSLSNNQLTSVNVATNSALNNLSLENNSNLTELNVTANTSLTTLFINNTAIDYIDLSHNTSLIGLRATGTRVKTNARASKNTDGNNYVFDYSGIRFLFDEGGSWSYFPTDEDRYELDLQAKTATIPDRDSLALGFPARRLVGGNTYTLTIDANPALITTTIYIDDTRYDVAYTSDRYINETWDSNDELEDIRSFINNDASLAELKTALADASLIRVEAFQTGSDTPNENVGLSEDVTTTHVFGTVPRIANPNITLVYYFDAPDATDAKTPSTPETGAFTKSEEGLKTNLSLFVASAFATFALVVLGYFLKRQKAKARIRFQQYR